MIRKLLLSALAAATIAGATAATDAPMARVDASATRQHRGVKLTPEQARVVAAVSGHRQNSSLPIAGKGQLKRLPSGPGILKSPSKINPSGSNIQGWRISDQFGDMPSGWYELNLDGTENFLWDYHDPNWVDDGFSDEPAFPFTTGFYKDDRVYGFHGEMLMYWLLWGYGSFNLDGEILDYHQYGDELDVTDFSTYVISCVYDQDKDKAYAYTLNADASAYMLQSIDLATWTFTPILASVPIENVCVGFAYNPVDKKIYGYTPDARFVTFNGETGELSTVAKLTFPVTTKLQGMTYSPLDKGFVFVFTNNNDDDAQLYFIKPSGEVTFLADLPDALQYNILITPDKIVDPLTPKTPVIDALNFAGGNLQGTATVTMPTLTFSEQPISGSLTLMTYVDGTLVKETQATAGQKVDVAISGLQEGTRKFEFSAKQGELESARVAQKKFVGYDTPLAPTDIELEEGNLTWSAVTEGVNGGYIDAESLTYNIYLNGEKINAAPVKGTSYTFTMPQEVFCKYVAQVEAVNHGHASDRGFSNDIKYGHAFPLPFSMKPTVAEGELIQVFSERGGWYEWRVNTDAQDPYMYCSLSSFGNTMEEWAILPVISVADSDKLLEISFDVRVHAGFSDSANENLSVAFGTERNPQGMKIFKSWTGLNNTEEWQTLKAYCLPSAGDTYFGFMASTRENGGDVMVRNIRIALSDRSSMTPSEVTDLTATALPQGALKAKVNFRMPETSAAGLSLQGQTLTATITTGAETVTVTGAPGSRQSAEVKTLQGWNNITVIAKNANAGLDNSVTVFTGLDVPQPLDGISISHNEDYKALHLSWNAPTQGFNGGYVDPAEVGYSLYLYNDEKYEWQFAQDLGTNTEYDFNPNVAEGLQLAGGAILSTNAQGNSGIVLSFEAPAGTPYILPVIENFNDEEHWGPLYEPSMLEKPNDTYVAEWGFYDAVYPYHIPELTPYGEGAYCVFGESGQKARIALPVFSTIGIESAAIELPVWCGPEAAAIEVYAEAYGMAPELIGSFSDPSTATWRKHRFHIPAKFLGKKWVALKIDAVFNEGNTVAAFADYRIKTFVRNDIGLLEMKAPNFALAGEEITVTTKVENGGTETTAMPQMTLEIYKNGKLLQSMPMTPDEDKAQLQELEQMQFSANWTPDGNACGDLTFKVVCASQDMDDSNNSLSAQCTVTKGNEPVITDLSAKEGDGDVIDLKWTEPAAANGKEGFENFTPYYYGDRLGDFKSINADGMQTWYFAGFRYPYDSASRGWQVLGEKEMTELMTAGDVENKHLHANSGNNLIAAFAPLSYIVGEDLKAEKWLVSPQLVAGSEFKFMLSAGWDGYQENIEVLYSTTDDSPESFVHFDDILLLSAGWKEYSYTLPEDARYFAIVYRSSSATGFFAMLDDITYRPVGKGYTVVGYDILRDGLNINENVSAHGSWTDRYVLPEDGAVYNVVPVIESDGTVSRGLKSNDARTGTNGIDGIVGDAVKVTAGKGFVKITGAEGRTVTVNTVDGLTVANVKAAAEETIRLNAGVYILRIGNQTHRVLVK